MQFSKVLANNPNPTILKIFLLLGLFLLSRLTFLNSGPAFFDSPEYLRRFGIDSFLQAMIEGHPPLHAGYILLFWPIFNLGQLLGGYGALLVVFAQAFLATIAIWCFFQSILLLTNKQIALWASVVASLLPLWWIATGSIMMEAAYASAYLISFYFFLLFLKKEKPTFFLISMACFFVALLTHIAVIFWVTLFFFTVFRVSKKQKGKFILYAASGFVATTIAMIYFLAIVSNLSFFESATLIFASKTGEHMQIPVSAIGIAQFMRNIFIPTIANNTSLVLILSAVSLFVLWKKEKSLFLFGFLWLLPITVVSNWWDSLLFGRHALLASFGFAFLVGSLLEKHKKIFFLVISYLLIVSLLAMILLRQPIPYIEEANAIEKLPREGLLIETHFARPQVERIYKGKIIFVNEPGWNSINTPGEIRKFLANKKSVFITSQALSDPYGLYSGPYIHSLSLSYAHPFALEGIINQFTLQKYKIIDEEDNLLIYRIITNKPSPYPDIKKMNQSRRRIDYFDPITQLVNIYFKI